MQVVRWRKPVTFSLAIIFLALALWGIFDYYNRNIKIDPAVVWQDAITNTFAVDSYRYTVKMDLEVENRKVQLTDITGEKSGNNFHFTGLMQNQKTEAYQIDGTSYLKDTLSDKWFVISDNDVFQNEYFLAEINPLSCFKFLKISDLKYLGIAKENMKRYYLFTCKPEVDNPFFNRFFKDFEYKLWVEKSKKRIVKAKITAVNTSKPENKLNLEVNLYDFDLKMKFTPPVKKK